MKNAEEVLAHAGVKGMKWGVRKDPSSNVKTSRAEQSLARGNKQLSRSGGKVNSAAAKIAGKAIAGKILTNVGANLTHKLTGSLHFSSGVAAVGNFTNAYKTVSSAVDLHRAATARK